MQMFRFGLIPILAFWCIVAADPFAQAAPVAKSTTSGDGIELEYTASDGTAIKTVFPVHRAGGVEYFSAGTGVEERSAKYPPYPLKLIFIAGPKAYLAQVTVSIKDAKGAVDLSVPDEQVTGPWLFVKLPAGAYDITATRRDKSEIKQRVEVGAGGSKTVYFRWKE